MNLLHQSLRKNCNDGKRTHRTLPIGRLRNACGKFPGRAFRSTQKRQKAHTSIPCQTVMIWQTKRAYYFRLWTSRYRRGRSSAQWQSWISGWGHGDSAYACKFWKLLLITYFLLHAWLPPDRVVCFTFWFSSLVSPPEWRNKERPCPYNDRGTIRLSCHHRWTYRTSTFPLGCQRSNPSSQ